MTMTFASFTLALAACGLVSAATTYDMIKEYRGSGFFDDWTFYNHCVFIFCINCICAHLPAVDNLTNGDAMYF